MPILLSNYSFLSYFVSFQFVRRKSHYTTIVNLFDSFHDKNIFCILTNLPFNSNAPCELADIDWDNLSFNFTPTDYMYSMKCSQGESFSKGELQRFGNIELSPSAGILNYGQVSSLNPYVVLKFTCLL